MEQVSSEMMKMLERMAAQMLNDGVTPDVFSADMDAFTRAYMSADIKKTEAMTTAYFTKPDFRREVIITMAQIATA